MGFGGVYFDVGLAEHEPCVFPCIEGSEEDACESDNAVAEASTFDAADATGDAGDDEGGDDVVDFGFHGDPAIAMAVVVGLDEEEGEKGDAQCDP